MNTTARNKATYLRNRGPLIWCQLAASRKRSNMPFFLSIIRSPRIRRPDEARLWRRFAVPQGRARGVLGRLLRASWRAPFDKSVGRQCNRHNSDEQRDNIWEPPAARRDAVRRFPGLLPGMTVRQQ